MDGQKSKWFTEQINKHFGHGPIISRIGSICVPSYWHWKPMQHITTRLAQLCLWFVAVISLPATAADVQTNYADFNVTLKSVEGSYPVGTPIIVTITMTNGTRNRVLWDLPLAGCSCVFGYLEVKSLTTKTNLPCLWMDNLSRSGHEQVWPDPGAVSSSRIDLSDRFGLRNPGTYEVRLLGRMPNPIVVDNKEPTVPTPPVIITITNVPSTTNVAPSKVQPQK
jgi:hypothetical protein